MSYKLTFGKYEGKTFEWLFFKAPWYVEWIVGNGIHDQRHNFDEEERTYFLNLYRRARNVTTICHDCYDRPVTRLGLTWQRNGNLGMVGFYCDECEYLGGSATEYHPASFFVDARTLNRCEMLRVAGEIQRMWIPDGNLTQVKMEQFFRTDDNFPDARPSAFEQLKAEVMG